MSRYWVYFSFIETAYVVVINIDTALDMNDSRIVLLDKFKAFRVLNFGLLSTVQILSRQEFRSKLAAAFKRN